jgi:hypothetical protein
MNELALKYPPPISCYYYFCENVDGGFKYIYLHGLDGNKLGFKSIFVPFNENVAPVLQLERLPKGLAGNWQNIKRELLDRTR